MRHIPATMATQHPDNASAPYWDTEGDGYVNLYEEVPELLACFQDLGVEEFMWDWEGKYADEAVIEKLFSNYYEFFKKHNLGEDKFLTFRIPNVWKEQGYSLIRALMVILTSEDFARDLQFHSPPLFEVILPMTEKAEQLIYIQKAFQKLARFKYQVFNHRPDQNTDLLDIIPLVEGMDGQLKIRKLLNSYYDQYRKTFKTRPVYMRPFLARSDPALISGLVATMLANKVAISESYEFGREKGVKIFPIVGVGSLIFRGGLSPERLDTFLAEYKGIRTVTIQSAFRYDYPKKDVSKAVATLNRKLPDSEPEIISNKYRRELSLLAKLFEKSYQKTVAGILKDLTPFINAVPRRRERRQHIGLLAYKRSLGKHSMPRAINYTAALYSLGVPPEFLGLSAFKKLSRDEISLIIKHYKNLRSDLVEAGRYINFENLESLAKQNSRWNAVVSDIKIAETTLGLTLGPKSVTDFMHRNLSSNVLIMKHKPELLSRLIIETGEIRKSLG